MSKLRIGIIGAGGRGIRSFGYNLSRSHGETTEIMALADPNVERAKAGLKYLGIETDVHAEVGDLVSRKDIDAVIVTTPDYLHEECCIAAFRGGKHVFVDKPLAVTGSGCLNIIEASRKAGRLLYMGFNLRHDAVLHRLKGLVESGTFGEIFAIHAVEHYDGGRTYMSRWNRLKKYSGGLWIHKGSHDFDIINWLMGEARPVRVSCFANVNVLREKGLPFQVREGVKPGPTCSECPYQSECPDVCPRAVSRPDATDAEKAAAEMYGEAASAIDGYHVDLCMYLSDKDTHDQGVAIIEYDNGGTAMHSECFFTPISNRQYMIDGDLGHGEADLHSNRIEIRPRWSQNRIIHEITRGAGGHGGTDPTMLQEFLRCLKEGSAPRASGVDGAWSVAIGEAAEIARAEKRVVEIKEVLDVDSDLLKTGN